MSYYKRLKTTVFFLISAIILNAQNYQALKTEYSAQKQNKSCYTLTPKQDWSVGGIWSKNTVPINQDFSFRFRVNFGTNKDPFGADGIAFLLALENEIKDSSSGKYLGVKNIKPSIHLELDVFKNITGDIDFNDPDQSHLAFFKNGNGKHLDTNCLTKDNFNDGWIQLDAAKTNVQDGNWYSIKVEYNYSLKQLTAYVNNVKRNTIDIDISKDIFNDINNVYWGITSSTGGASNHHQVCFLWDTTQIETPKEYVLPNAFSPNGDGINELFEVKTLSEIKVNRYLIYNRWGQLIYDNSVPWNGIFNGKISPNGVYLVVVELQRSNGETFKITGDVTLFK